MQQTIIFSSCYGHQTCQRHPYRNLYIYRKNKKYQEIANDLIKEIKNKTNNCVIYQGVININQKHLPLSEDIPEVFRHLVASENYTKPHHLLNYMNMSKRVQLVEKNYVILNKNPKEYFYIILYIPHEIRYKYEILLQTEKSIVDNILDNNGIYIDLMKWPDHTMVGIKKNIVKLE